MIVTSKTWTVEADVTATRQVYSTLEKGGSASCGCESCMRYIATHHIVFPSETIHFLEELGVDTKIEVAHRIEILCGA
jgi:hypothetical protein